MWTPHFRSNKYIPSTRSYLKTMIFDANSLAWNSADLTPDENNLIEHSWWWWNIWRATLGWITIDIVRSFTTFKKGNRVKIAWRDARVQSSWKHLSLYLWEAACILRAVQKVAKHEIRCLPIKWDRNSKNWGTLCFQITMYLNTGCLQGIR